MMQILLYSYLLLLKTDGMQSYGTECCAIFSTNVYICQNDFQLP